MEEDGDDARLGGYACRTAVLIDLVFGVVDVDAATVAVPELEPALLSSCEGDCARLLRSRDREREREGIRGFSMSYRAERPSSGSSSSDARKSGSRSGSSEARGESEASASGVWLDPLTIESISQNCRMFMKMGNRPITLRTCQPWLRMRRREVGAHKMTCAVSLGPRNVSSHSPILKMPGNAAKRATTRSFIVVRART